MQKQDLHPTQLNTWKRDFIAHYTAVFEKDSKGSARNQDKLIQALYAQIGDLKVANDFLKKRYSTFFG